MRCAWVIAVFVTAAAMLNASDLRSILRQGDALDQEDRNAEALEVFRKAEALAPDDAEVLHRIAKQHAQMMSDVKARNEKVRLGRTALEYAERAVRADPQNSDARLTLAICLGKFAFFESPGTRMEYSRRIRSEAEEALRLNPQNDYALHVLGRWHYEFATLNPALRVVAQTIYGRLPDASLDAAADHFERAIAVGPPRVIHHIELGRTYKAMGRTEEAREQLERGLRLPSREKDDEDTKTRGRKALASL